MKLRAPAKINFGLRVVGRRKDGYHLLDTIILPVSLYDDIQIQKLAPREVSRPQIEVTCSDPTVPGGDGNLAYRAAQLLMDRTRTTARVRIHIEKRIPVGAGLGGGSSDAATTLRGLNRLLGPRLSTRELKRLALRLGADVPFFVEARPAHARGVGERLTYLADLPTLWFVILYPGFAVSTAWVYKKLPLTLTKRAAHTSITGFFASSPDYDELLVNDLEPVTSRKYPVIGRLKKDLAREGAVATLMSGSGSSVFGVFESRRSALEAFGRLTRLEGVRAFLVRNLG